jgi:hydroxyacylglutathione hydrolase
MFDLVVRDERLEILRLETAPFGTNAYLITCLESGETLLVDAPGDADAILEKLKGSSIELIVITHGHMDHLMVLEELGNALVAEIAVHEGDAGMLPVKADRLLEDGEVLECGNLKLEVLHTPGHTPGSICLRVDGYLISGDTIFPGGPGKTATVEDFQTVLTSIREAVLTLPDETVILPGHGAATTVGKERPLIEAFIANNRDADTFGEVTWSSS